MDSSYNNKDFFKLIQLKKALVYNYNIKIIERLLEKEYDINYAFPDNDSLKKSDSFHIGDTALHLASHMDHSDVFMYLLSHGADFTKVNKAGDTALHNLMIWSELRNDEYEPINNSLINAVFSAHVWTQNFSNPRDKNGLSHLHIACMTNNATRAVEFFLDNQISVDESVSVNSTLPAGSTPLHFAAMCTNTKVAEILLAYGANIHITDTTGKTPLHILIERRLKMLDSLAVSESRKVDFYEKLKKQIQDNDKFINMLLENMSTDNDCLDNIGLSNFHVACVLQDMSVAENLSDQVKDLNQCVHEDSRLWPGYTAVHFAARFSTNTVEMLIKKGVNVELRDTNGLTLLDICVERYKIEDIYRIMSLSPQWKNILFSDGVTTLLSLVGALADINSFKNLMKYSNKDINMRIPMESTLWPGYTPLHLAVLFAERSKLREHISDDQKEMDLKIIRFCLSQGADLSHQESRGRTPLHLAFRLNKETVVDMLFRHSRQIPIVFDEDNLSHVHIACASINRKPKLKKCVLDHSVVNEAYKGSTKIHSIQPGWTPLHLCLTYQSWQDNESIATVINTLLKYNADPNIKDSFGLTPIHWLLNYNLDSVTINKLLKKAPNDCVAEEYGLSYLHIACRVDNVTAVKRFLENGADVNLAIKYSRQSNGDSLYFLSTHDQHTPLHMFRLSSNKAAKLLIKHGADIFAKESHGWVYHGFYDYFMPKLLNDNELRNRMTEEFGWTKIFLACHFLQIDGFEDLVKAELADINKQVFSNSPGWEGYTPLHKLTCRLHTRMKHSDEEKKKIDSMVKILLENGADVTIMNDEQNTPLSMLFTDYADGIVQKQAALLMKYHKDFNVNPMNKLGISHFHRACQLNDVEAIKGFLLHGVDVNHPIDYFSYWRPGYIPLHLVSKLDVVDLLVSHGANVHIEDVEGCTVLQEAVTRKNFDEDFIMKIIESGAEINGSNFRGITPFEAVINSSKQITVEKLKFFINQGFHVNSCNPITGVGYLSMMLAKLYRDRNVQTTLIEMMMYERSTDVFGRTSLHHLVANWSYSPFDCVALLEKLIKDGHDIDEKDNAGKTALRLAVEFQNKQCLNQLLMCGADVNVLDIHKHSPLSYLKSAQKSFRNEYLKDTLTVHACRLVFLKLDLNQIDMDDVRNARESIRAIATQSNFLNQIAMSKDIQLGVRSIRLYDFLSETGALTIYPFLNHLERCQIDQYFENLNNDDRLKEIRSFLKLQYRKAAKRSQLISRATSSLRHLLDFNLPDLCAENLFQYLPNSDLQNVIQADIETEDVQMDVG